MRRIWGVVGALVVCAALAAPARADEGISPTARFGLGYGMPYGNAGINADIGFNILGLKVSAVGGIGAMPGQISHKVALGRAVGVRAGLALGIVEPRVSLMYGTVGFVERTTYNTSGTMTAVSMQTYKDWAAGVGFRVNITHTTALEADVLYTPNIFDGARLRDGIRYGNGTIKGALGLSMGF